MSIVWSRAGDKTSSFNRKKPRQILTVCPKEIRSHKEGGGGGRETDLKTNLSAKGEDFKALRRERHDASNGRAEDIFRKGRGWRRTSTHTFATTMPQDSNIHTRSGGFKGVGGGCGTFFVTSTVVIVHSSSRTECAPFRRTSR